MQFCSKLRRDESNQSELGWARVWLRRGCESPWHHRENELLTLPGQPPWTTYHSGHQWNECCNTHYPIKGCLQISKDHKTVLAHRSLAHSYRTGSFYRKMGNEKVGLGAWVIKGGLGWLCTEGLRGQQKGWRWRWVWSSYLDSQNV